MKFVSLFVSSCVVHFPNPFVRPTFLRGGKFYKRNRYFPKSVNTLRRLRDHLVCDFKLPKLGYGNTGARVGPSALRLCEIVTNLVAEEYKIRTYPELFHRDNSFFLLILPISLLAQTLRGFSRHGEPDGNGWDYSDYNHYDSNTKA